MEILLSSAVIRVFRLLLKNWFECSWALSKEHIDDVLNCFFNFKVLRWGVAFIPSVSQLVASVQFSLIMFFSWLKRWL